MSLALCLVSLWWMRRIHERWPMMERKNLSITPYRAPAEDGGSNRNEVGSSVL